MKVCDTEIAVSGGLVRVARVAAEGFEFFASPAEALAAIRQSRTRIDLLTFLPTLRTASVPCHYPAEPDNFAALPITTFDHWWTKQIDGKTRNMVRRAEKKQVVVREVAFDDALARGIHDIYNESPVRQGRPFPHYGKDFDTVRRMSATFPEQSVFVGAFLGEQLIGFLKLTWDAGRSQAAVMHIIAMLAHRDKAPTNALLAEGVRACERRGIPWLVYSKFAYGKKQSDSLRAFKESNGFQRIDLPRYYVPLTATGALAWRLGLHRRLIDRLPASLLERLRELRNSWYNRRTQTPAAAS